MDYVSHPLPEECMLSGVILDSAPIVEALCSMKFAKPKLFKDTSLVVDGNFVFSKRMTVPDKLSKLLCDDVIRDEFSEISSDTDNLICDYTLLDYNSDGARNILACAVESAHAKAYISLFEAAKIELSSIHLGLSTVLQFVDQTPELKDKPFVLNIVDDVVMLSMIFHNGENVFQSRTRLYGEDRSMLVSSTLDGLSGIIQFNKSQNFENITNCYYLGLDDLDIETIVHNTSYPEIAFSKLDIYKNTKKVALLPPDAHFAYLNTLMPNSKPDLLSNMKMLEKAKKRKQSKNAWIPIFASAAVLIVALIAALWIITASVEEDIRELTDFLENPNTITERDRLDELNFSTAHFSTLYESVANLQDDIENRYTINRKVLDVLEESSGSSVEINSINFSYSNEKISITCSSLTEHDASEFVESLKNNPAFNNFDVYYTGYASGAGGEYIFSIDIVERIQET